MDPEDSGEFGGPKRSGLDHTFGRRNNGLHHLLPPPIHHVLGTTVDFHHSNLPLFASFEAKRSDSNVKVYPVHHQSSLNYDWRTLSLRIFPVPTLNSRGVPCLFGSVCTLTGNSLDESDVSLGGRHVSSGGSPSSTN